MKKLTISVSCLALTSLLGAHGAQAQIFSNAITGTNPSATNPYTAGQVVDPNITVTGIGRFTGTAPVGLIAATANDRFSATGYNGADLAASITNSDYFTFTITPNAGASINFGDLTFTLQSSGTGPTTFALLSSVGGFQNGSQIATSPSTAGGTLLTVPDATLGSAYDTITSPVEFRLYGFGASAATGTGSVNDFSFGGVVTVPEPSTYAMMAGGLGLLLLGQRARRTVRA